MDQANQMDKEQEISAPDAAESASADQTRKKSIKLGIITSLVSKFFGAIVQLGAIPIAITTLAQGHYDVYTFLQNQAMLLGLLNLGTGPAVVPELSRYATHPNHEQERIWFSNSFWTGVISTLFLAVLIALAAPFIPVEWYVGKQFYAYEDLIRQGLFAFALILVIRSVIMQITFAYTGYMEEYRMKLIISIGYFLSIPAVLWVAYRAPNPSLLVLAVAAVPFATQYLSAYRFWKHDRPYMVPRWRDLELAKAWKLFRDNAYNSISAAGSTVTRTVPMLMATHFAATESEVGYFGTLLGWFLLALTVVVMLASAIMPTISNAYNHRDFSWVRRATVKGFGATTLFGFGCTVFCGAALPWLTRLLFASKPEYHVTTLDSVLLGTLIWVAGYEALLQGYMVASGKFWQAGLIGLIGSIVAIVLSLMLMPHSVATGGMISVVVSMLVSCLLAFGALYRDVFAPAFHRPA